MYSSLVYKVSTGNNKLLVKRDQQKEKRKKKKLNPLWLKAAGEEDTFCGM
jgi:hypothetical protein